MFPLTCCDSTSLGKSFAKPVLRNWLSRLPPGAGISAGRRLRVAAFFEFTNLVKEGQPVKRATCSPLQLAHLGGISVERLGRVHSLEL